MLPTYPFAVDITSWYQKQLRKSSCTTQSCPKNIFIKSSQIKSLEPKNNKNERKFKLIKIAGAIYWLKNVTHMLIFQLFLILTSA